jgi:hypothetical protein
MATKKPRTKEISSPKETPAIPARLLALLKETAAPRRFVNPAPAESETQRSSGATCGKCKPHQAGRRTVRGENAGRNQK